MLSNSKKGQRDWVPNSGTPGLQKSLVLWFERAPFGYSLSQILKLSDFLLTAFLFMYSEPEVNLLNDIQVGDVLLEDHRDKQSCIQHDGGHQGEMSVIVEVIIAMANLWTEGSLARPAMSGSAPCRECRRCPRLISILSHHSHHHIPKIFLTIQDHQSENSFRPI